MKKNFVIWELILNAFRVLNIKFPEDRNFLIACGFLFAVNILFLFLPVLKFFSYEASVLNAVLITFLSGLSYFKSTLEVSKPGGGLKTFITKAVIYLLIPPVVYFFGHLFLGDCSFLNGIKYYTVFCLTAPLVGGAISAVVLLTGIKFRKTVFTILFMLVLFNWIVDFYLYPQFYLYNAIFTFYPGVIYDEFIPVTEKMVLYRGVISIISLVIIIVEIAFRTKEIRERLIFGVVIIILLPAISYFASREAGLITLRENFTENFKDGVVTPHFLILSEEKLTPSELEYVANLHEVYYHELVKYYKIKPPEHLQSVIFKDSKSKKMYLGVENADVAKPWLRQAYTTRANLEKSLKHELAHLFTAEFGWSIFKVAHNFKPGLIEGAATTADGVVGGYAIDEFAAAALNSKYRVEVEQVFPGFGFFNVNPTLAYLVSGAFSRFLIETSGIQKFREYYETGDFEAVYTKPLEEYSGEFKKKMSLLRSDISQGTLDFYFDRKPLLQKTCPRYFAEQMAEASDYFRNKDWTGALEIYQRLSESTGSFSTVAGKINCLMLLKENSKALSVTEEYQKNNLSYSDRLNSQLLRYSIVYLTGDTVAIRNIRKLFYDHDVPDFMLSAFKLREQLLENGVDPFLYSSLGSGERLRTLSSIKKKNSVIYEAIVDILYNGVLPFPGGINLKDCLGNISDSGKLKLCTVLVRSDKHKNVSVALSEIDEKKLLLQQEISKYRIFKAVFAK